MSGVQMEGMGSGGENIKLVVDTKSACFFCLKRGDEEDERKPKSYMELCRYLKFDFKKIFNLGGNSRGEGDDWAEIMVSLCKQCCSVVTKFQKEFEQLEEIRRNLKESVESIHEILSSADGDDYRVREYHQLITNPGQRIIADKLRTETRQTCYLRLSKQSNLEGMSSPNPVEEGVPQEDYLGGMVTNMQQVPGGIPSSLIGDAFIMEENVGLKLEISEEEMGGSSLFLDEDPLLNSGEGALISTEENEGWLAEPEIGGTHKDSEEWMKQILKRKQTNQSIFFHHLMTIEGNIAVQQCPYCPRCFYNDIPKLKHHLFDTHFQNLFEDDWKRSRLSPKKFEVAMRSQIEDCSRRRNNCKFCGCLCSTRSSMVIHLLDSHHHRMVTIVEASAGTKKSKMVNRIDKIGGGGGSSRFRRKFLCACCPKHFHLEDQRHLHMFKSHRTEVFAKYFSAGTTADEMDKMVKRVLLRHHHKYLGCGSSGGTLFKCRHCQEKFMAASVVENHVLICHFSQVEKQLMEFREQGGRSSKMGASTSNAAATSRSPPGDGGNSEEGMMLFGESEPVVKEEVVDQSDIKIVPDLL